MKGDVINNTILRDCVRDQWIDGPQPVSNNDLVAWARNVQPDRVTLNETNRISHIDGFEVVTDKRGYSLNNDTGFTIRYTREQNYIVNRKA